MGTSFKDVRERSIVWTRVYLDYIWALLMHASLSTDIPILLLNQPNKLFRTGPLAYLVVVTAADGDLCHIPYVSVIARFAPYFGHVPR